MKELNSQPETQGLVERYLGGQLSRRQFVIQGLALGLSMTSISALLAACSNAGTSESTTPK